MHVVVIVVQHFNLCKLFGFLIITYFCIKFVIIIIKYGKVEFLFLVQFSRNEKLFGVVKWWKMKIANILMAA